MAGVEIQSERIDDIPLLIHQQERMGIPEVVNSVGTIHGNRQGLSMGRLISVWVSYILSEADHRMSEVETWVAERMECLSALLLEPVREKDFTDDRLADVLCWLSDDGHWAEVERQGTTTSELYAATNQTECGTGFSSNAVTYILARRSDTKFA